MTKEYKLNGKVYATYSSFRKAQKKHFDNERKQEQARKRKVDNRKWSDHSDFSNEEFAKNFGNPIKRYFGKDKIKTDQFADARAELRAYREYQQFVKRRNEGVIYRPKDELAILKKYVDLYEKNRGRLNPSPTAYGKRPAEDQSFPARSTRPKVELPVFVPNKEMGKKVSFDDALYAALDVWERNNLPGREKLPLIVKEVIKETGKQRSGGTQPMDWSSTSQRRIHSFKPGSAPTGRYAKTYKRIKGKPRYKKRAKINGLLSRYEYGGTVSGTQAATIVHAAGAFEVNDSVAYAFLKEIVRLGWKVNIGHVSEFMPCNGRIKIARANATVPGTPNEIVVKTFQDTDVFSTVAKDIFGTAAPTGIFQSGTQDKFDWLYVVLEEIEDPAVGSYTQIAKLDANKIYISVGFRQSLTIQNTTKSGITTETQNDNSDSNHVASNPVKCTMYQSNKKWNAGFLMKPASQNAADLFHSNMLIPKREYGVRSTGISSTAHPYHPKPMMGWELQNKVTTRKITLQPGEIKKMVLKFNGKFTLNGYQRKFYPSLSTASTDTDVFEFGFAQMLWAEKSLDSRQNNAQPITLDYEVNTEIITNVKTHQTQYTLPLITVGATQV